MKKIYISIPILGHSLTIIPRYSEACKHIRNFYGGDNVKIYYPYDLLSGNIRNDENSYAYYKGKDVELMLECDIIYFGVGWEDSKGCQLAYQLAKIYDKQILTYKDINI